MTDQLTGLQTHNTTQNDKVKAKWVDSFQICLVSEFYLHLGVTMGTLSSPKNKNGVIIFPFMWFKTCV